MSDFAGGNAFHVVLVLVFVAVVLSVEGSYLLWRSYHGPAARKIQNRLRTIGADPASPGQTRLLRDRMPGEAPAIERWLLAVPRARAVQRHIVQAGLDGAVSRLAVTSAVLAGAACVATIGFAHQTLLSGLFAGAAIGSLPIVYVSVKRSRRLAKFERLFPEALDLITSALRSGQSFSSALLLVGEEMPEPVAGEFRAVHDEINFGVSLQQALTNLTERIPLTDLRYFAVAVLIQRESGGNVTEVLSNLGRLIRERLKFSARIRVLSADGRLSAWILILMPFALAGLMNLLNPGFMSPLWTDPIGISMVRVLLVLMAFGILVLRGIVKIRV